MRRFERWRDHAGRDTTQILENINAPFSNLARSAGREQAGFKAQEQAKHKNTIS
jgi:hypothetical protein